LDEVIENSIEFKIVNIQNAIPYIKIVWIDY